jgi:hypothetical protein
MLGMLLAIASLLALAMQGPGVSPWTFQALLALIGIGFGPTPPLTAVAMQNVVVPHQFGTAVGALNFSRSLFGTVLVAAFGAILLAGAPTGVPIGLDPHAAEGAAPYLAVGFTRVFYAAAASLAVAFLALALLEEKPLKTGWPQE